MKEDLTVNTMNTTNRRPDHCSEYRLEICEKIYMTGFFGQKIYTLKVRKLRQFLLKKKQRKCINISHFHRFFDKIQLSV